MINDFPAGYLDGLSASQRAELARVNEPGLTALREQRRQGRDIDNNPQ